MDHTAGPRSPLVVDDTRSIELARDFNVGLALVNELMEYPSDDRCLFVGADPKPHAVCLQGLALALG
jgi:hypothetical protein